MWSIPSPPRRRSNPNPFLPKPFPTTFWVRKDLLAAGNFTRADCHPAVVRSFDPPPKLICLPCEGIGPGSRSFAEVVKGGVEMADKRPSGSSSGAASQWGLVSELRPLSTCKVQPILVKTLFLCRKPNLLRLLPPLLKSLLQLWLLK